MEENMNNIQSEFIPLGRKLRNIVEKIKVGKELEALGNKLEELANAGNTSAQFTDLRKYVPSVVNSGGIDVIKDWAIKNELVINGATDMSTGAWAYTISWDI